MLSPSPWACVRAGTDPAPALDPSEEWAQAPGIGSGLGLATALRSPLISFLSVMFALGRKALLSGGLDLTSGWWLD